MKAVWTAIVVGILEWLFRKLYGPIRAHIDLKRRFEEIENENRRLRENLERAETELEREIATREIAKRSF
jgi:hypothetical protein